MRKSGFTLIELSIVVAIIAILAAIAVPNFMEAQVRAKVTRVKSDQRSLATGLDIMPTLCDYAGIKPPKNMRGKSLRPLLEGKSAPWREYIVTEMPGNRARMVRSQRYKYANYFEDPVEMLFDMVNDPGETRNLSSDPAHAGVLLEHRKMLQKWELQLDTAPDVPNPDAWRRLV